MEIRNIAVVLDIETVDPDLVALASELARRHHATLVGVAAAEPPVTLMGLDGGDVAGALYAEQRAQIEASLAGARQNFATLVPSGVKHQWAEAVQRPDVAIVSLARTVDLIIVGSPVRVWHWSGNRHWRGSTRVRSSSSHRRLRPTQAQSQQDCHRLEGHQRGS